MSYDWCPYFHDNQIVKYRVKTYILATSTWPQQQIQHKIKNKKYLFLVVRQPFLLPYTLLDNIRLLLQSKKLSPSQDNVNTTIMKRFL